MMTKLKDFLHRRPSAWYMLYLPVYLLLFFAVEKLVPSTCDYWVSYLPLDAYIPFCEFFVVFYCMWYPLLIATAIYLFVNDDHSFRLYGWFIIIGFTGTLLFCLIFPNGQDLRPAELPRQNICTWILQMTWAADNNANVFPSVHVLGVVAAIAAMWHSPKLKRVWQIVGTVWFVIIAASTLLVKQRAFIDLAAALVWGAVVYVIVYVIIGHKRDKMGLRCGAEDPGREDGHDHSPDPRI